MIEIDPAAHLTLFDYSGLKEYISRANRSGREPRFRTAWLPATVADNNNMFDFRARGPRPPSWCSIKKTKMLSYQTWVECKVRLAQELEGGAFGAGYDEGAIILCATISAMSSLLWLPSNGTDGRRFVEIVVRFRSGSHDPTRISSPLLAEKLPQLSQDLGVSRLSIYLTDEVDKPEAYAAALCARLDLPDCEFSARDYSHPSQNVGLPVPPVWWMDEKTCRA